MKNLRENLTLQWRGFKLSRRISGRFHILYETLISLLPTVATYISANLAGRVITALTQNKPFREPFGYALAAAGVTLLLWFFRQLLSRRARTLRATMRYRREIVLTQKALSLDFTQTENPETASLIGRVEDNVESFNGITRSVMDVSSILANSLSVVIAIVMASGMVMERADTPQAGILALANSPLFGALFAVLVLSLSLLTLLANDATAKRRFAAHERFGKINAVWKYYYDRVLNENGSGEDIRVYHEKPLIWEELREHVFEAKRAVLVLYLRADVTFGLIPMIVTALTGGAVYLFVGLKALSGAFGAGKVVEYYAVITQMITSFSFIAVHLGLLRSNRIHLREDLSFFEMRAQMENGTRTASDVDPENVEFAFHDVSFRYPGTEPLVLDHLNLTIRSGERLAVVGRNGSGKSTMIKLLCRLYDPTAGTITVNGIDIREFDYQEYLKLFGIVFQDFHLLAFSVAENVACSETYDAEKVWQCLDTAGLRKRVEKMPKGLSQCVTKLYEEDGVDLSGGEGQKLAIARALYKDAPFIILDEPTAALDPKSEAEIYARFDEMSGGRTAVYISHRMSSCRFCDRIAVFDSGTVVEEGTHDALLTAAGEYAALWNAQAQHYAS